MKILLQFFVLLLFVLSARAQTDNIGSGRAVSFDGVDDYIQIGSHYHDLTLPISASAWIKFDVPSGADNLFPIFVTTENAYLIYRGFWFYALSTAIVAEIGDGTGGDNPAFRRGLAATFPDITGRWVNMCVVMKSPTDVKLYVNGIDVGGSSAGDSNLPMASSFANDTAAINYQYGNVGVIYRSKGQLDEVRLWNRPLTQTEVQQNMCKKLVGNESGLIGYWNFDEVSGNTVVDKSSNGFNGQLMNNPTRVFSGAPIGDDSKYLYTSNWSGSSVSLQDGDDQVTVNNVQGNPEGVHLYEVKSQPSQTGGLPSSAISQPYFGAFAASMHTGNSFDVAYLFKASQSCKTYIRVDNSIPSWTSSANPAANVSQRIELIKSSDQKINVDLGPDQTACNQSFVMLSTGVTDPKASFLWSTGETTPSINVTKSGSYSVAVSGACGIATDNIAVQFETSPPAISLGNNQVFCEFNPILLDPLVNSKGYHFLWQDGSTDSLFQAKDFGNYWVSVKNDCGTVSDTVTYTIFKNQVGFVPNVITPNGDGKNDYFKVDEELKGSVSLVVLNRWGKEVYRSHTYMNDWNGGDLSPGVYYVVISGSCIDESKDWLTIIK